MNLKPIVALAMLLIAGCHSTLTPQQKETNLLKLIHNDHIKRFEVAIPSLIVEPDGSLDADGIWIPEPDDKAHQLIYPEQARIICNKGEQSCLEMQLSFTSVGNEFVMVNGPEETIWPIKSWDKTSLLAEYGPFPMSSKLSDKCESHVLSIMFASGAVTTSDIPTDREGCEAIKETNSYRLAGGWYDVDTSPHNDAIKDTAPR
ncbi:MAG: hypothetical protein ABR865_15570 [Terracidiphilus sp.]|jgi:hypothetical protein